jgi:hypothetical protein
MAAGPKDEVGYRRPPAATRFRPGRSGNPSGRRKGARNLATILAAALAEPVAIGEDGNRRVSKLEAVIERLVERAASGVPRATQLLLALAQAEEEKQRKRPAEAETLSADDAFVLAELTRRLREADAT